MRRIFTAATMAATGLLAACATDSPSPLAPSQSAARITYGDGTGPIGTLTFVPRAVNSLGALQALCAGNLSKVNIGGSAEGVALGENIDVTERGAYLDWEAANGVTVLWVRMKGGTSENVYSYNPPPAQYDNNLVTPDNASGAPADISHYAICWTGEPVRQNAIIAVEKTAETSWKRAWTWDIDKSTTTTSVSLLLGQTQDVEYTLDVTGSSTDSDFKVTGIITVSNAGTAPASITSVADLLDGADVHCAVTLPYELAAGASFDCTYEAVVATRTPGTNTARVTATAVGTASLSPIDDATAEYSFSESPTEETNRKVSLYDSRYSGMSLPSEVEGDADGSPFEGEYTYSVTVGPYTAAACNTTTDFINRAEVRVYDTETALDSDEVRVPVSVNCSGCTPGYWSNTRRAYPNGNSPATLLNAGTALAAMSFPNATYAGLGNNSFSTAWGWSSGTTTEAMARQMLRHAAAALLNSYALPYYPLSTDEVRSEVAAAMNLGTRAAFEALKDRLDGFNNLGCTLPNR
jgi:hypothetical protein